MKIGVIAFTVGGRELQRQLISSIDEGFFPYEQSSGSAKEFVCEAFHNSDAIVFIGAIGIAVRMISQLIVSKDKDPAVVVLDEKGQFVVPILSGHIGGANRLALRIADAIDAMPVITTATDVHDLLAIDEWSILGGCVIDDTTKIKHISSAILNGREVGFVSDFAISGDVPTELSLLISGKLGVCVSLCGWKKPFEITLNIIPKIVTLGIGCRKGTPFELLEAFILKELELYNISVKSVKFIASIDLKKEEDCILKLSQKYCVPFVTYSAAELDAAPGEYIGSDFVKSTTGVDNVCERSAVLQSGGKLLVNKVSNNGMTLAVAMSDWWCTF